MSVYDELNDCIESAWSSDSCEYEVCSEMFDLIADAEYKYDNLKAENAKLKELVRDLYGCGDSCTHCKYWNQGEGFYCRLGVGWKARRLKELGIGADDD